MASRKSTKAPRKSGGADEFEARDVYIITTSKTGSRSSTQHRVWNTTRFFTSKEVESRFDGSSWEPVNKEEFSNFRRPA